VDFAGLVSEKLSGILVVRISEGKGSYDGERRMKIGGKFAATVSSHCAGVSIFFFFLLVSQGRFRSLKLICSLLQPQHLNLL